MTLAVVVESHGKGNGCPTIVSTLRCARLSSRCTSQHLRQSIILLYESLNAYQYLINALPIYAKIIDYLICQVKVHFMNKIFLCEKKIYRIRYTMIED